MRLTEEQMNRIADEFENDTFKHEDNPIYIGSHYVFVNNHGSKISSEEFELWAKEADAGDFSRWEAVGEPKFGKGV